MQLFRRILKPSDLPPSGTAYEQLNVDFKAPGAYQNRGPAPKWKAFEMAKDIAAFANALGGTLLIGAAEDSAKRVLGAYLPLSPQDAADYYVEFDQAVRDRCSPKPRFHVDRVPLDAGFVVAVNVEPFPGQPVGVRLDGQDAWIFPMRAGTHTKPIPPEHLPMLTDARARRMAIVLDSIPADARGNVSVYALNTKSPHHKDGAEFKAWKCTLVSVDLFENTVKFEAAAGEAGAGLPAFPFSVPLDDIESVWLSTKGTWAVRLRGAVARVLSATTEFDYAAVVWH